MPMCDQRTEIALSTLKVAFLLRKIVSVLIIFDKIIAKTRETEEIPMNDFLEILLSNLLELVLAAIAGVLSVFVVPWIKKTVIPWLQEKRLYTVVQHFVEAAEKYSENHQIDKKQYVVNLLHEKGIAVTTETEAYIESAVKQLDNSVQQVIDVITDSPESLTADNKPTGQ